jgi:hypothetical protein
MSLQQFLQGDGNFANRNDRGETDWLEVGELDLGGQLWIGDPCTVSRSFGFVIRLPGGMYSVEGRGLFDDEDGFPRVSRLRIVNSDARASRLGPKVGVCGTDTAMVALCDIEEVERVANEVGVEELRQRAIDAGQDGCGALDVYARGEMLRLVFSSTGYGDGTFPVLALLDGPRTVGVEIEFIEFL